MMFFCFLAMLLFRILGKGHVSIIDWYDLNTCFGSCQESGLTLTENVTTKKVI